MKRPRGENVYRAVFKDAYPVFIEADYYEVGTNWVKFYVRTPTGLRARELVNSVGSSTILSIDMVDEKPKEAVPK